MKTSTLIKISVSLFILTLFSFQFLVLNVSANSDGENNNDNNEQPSSGCLPPRDIPAECPDNYEPDFRCINAKILNPQTDCCENKCVGAASSVEEPIAFDQLEVFSGTKVYVRSDRKIIALLNVTVTTLLGLGSLYAGGRGIYIAAVKRAKTEDPEQIRAIYNELLKALIPGFLLLWLVIIIIQLVFSALGLGSLNELIIIGEPDPGTVITIN